MKPYLLSAGTTHHFQWNVDASVGKGGQNSNHADVMYIQWYYTLAAAHPETPPDRKIIYQRVKITGVCSGMDGDPLVDSIIAHQQRLQHPQIDGRISVAIQGVKIGSMAYFVFRLGSRFANMHPRAWPRLDLIQGCPAPVAAEVTAAIPRIG